MHFKVYKCFSFIVFNHISIQQRIYDDIIRWNQYFCIFAELHDFFIEIVKSLKNRFFFDFRVRKKSSKIIFSQFFFDFPENNDTSDSIWYIYFGLTPNSLENVLKRTQGVHFFLYSWYYLFSGTLICSNFVFGAKHQPIGRNFNFSILLYLYFFMFRKVVKRIQL